MRSQRPSSLSLQVLHVLFSILYLSIPNSSYRRSPGTVAGYDPFRIVSVLFFSGTDQLHGICVLLLVLHGGILRTDVLSCLFLPISSDCQCRRRCDALLSVACCRRDNRCQADLQEEYFSCVSFVFSLFRISEIINLPDPLCFLSCGRGIQVPPPVCCIWILDCTRYFDVSDSGTFIPLLHPSVSFNVPSMPNPSLQYNTPVTG